MIKIGNKKQIYSATFLAQDGELAEVEVSIQPNENLTLAFEFVVGHGGLGTISWNGEDSRVKFTLTDWRNSLGSTLKEPLKLGQINGEDLFFSLSHQLIGEKTNLVHIFLYLGV